MTKLEQAVREIVESYGEEKKSFVRDVLTYGCASGVVPELTYYHQTHKFYREHEDEIWELVEEWAEETGELPIEIGKDIRSQLAWFAFEVMVGRLYGHLV